MEFRLLGPLEVCRDGEQLVLGGPKQRAPESEHSLDVHLSRLRKTLTAVGEGEVLIRRGRGYLLRVEAASLDLVCFEQQIEAGERALAEGRPARRAGRCRRGPSR